MANKIPVASQKRSRQTSNNLLAATVRMFEQHGLEQTTVPRIAAAAGVSPGSIYRRFRDKDGLYRAAFLDLLERSVETNRKTIRPEFFKGASLEEAVSAIVSAILRQYRSQPQLLRALSRFLETHRDKAFRVRATRLIAQNFTGLVKALLVFRAKIAHPDPRRALTFAILTTVTAIEVRALEKSSMWQKMLDLSDEEMERELTRSFLGYLGQKPATLPAPARRRGVSRLDIPGRPGYARQQSRQLF